ncbi:Lysosome-associated membrane glycoprotein 1 [Taenia crassiceps]|uniref:Lysosome-associated membrane glycoprotein 1 n=1 Tax=Taenia crassiceps TaxID=6207 RepID=A0ABR4QE87_9CEST
MPVGLVFIVYLLSSLVLADANATTNEPTSVGSTTTTTVNPTGVGPSTTSSPDGVPKFCFFCNGMIDVIIQAKMELFVSYFDDKSSRTKSFVIGESAATNAVCGDEVDTINLQWSPERMPRSPSKISGSFIRKIGFDYFMSSDVFPLTNKTGPVSVSVNGSFFETPGAMGFTCTPQQNISLDGGVIFGVSSLHLETFRNSSHADFFEKALDCMDIPATNKVVPIIVGVSAAILILLAIVAFLIGNRRRAQGYQAL